MSEENAFVRGFNRGLVRGIIEGKKVSINEFLEDLDWIQEDFYNEDEENRNTVIKKKWEAKKNED